MEKSKITSFSGFFTIVESHGMYMYRGVSNVDYKLIPKVGRDWHLGLDVLRVTEQHMLDTFGIRATPYLEHRPSSMWELIAIAQHYGIPTRLLDWILNPLAALYFACKGKSSSDGLVYFARNICKSDLSKYPDPLNVDLSFGWTPEHIIPRLAAQDGLFTISKNPLKPFTRGIKRKVIIKAEAKPKLLRTLAEFGIHPGSLFPGLNGISEYIRTEHFWFKGFKDKDKLRKLIREEQKERFGET